MYVADEYIHTITLRSIFGDPRSDPRPAFSVSVSVSTMTTYLYELPTTGAISFSDFCVDKTASYNMSIADATQARANLRAALKESRHSDGERDFLRLVKVRSSP